MMGFTEPAWILIGLVCCMALLFLFHKLEKTRKQRLEKFAAPHLLGQLTANVSPAKRALKKYLVVLAMFCCFVSLARPYYNFQWVDVKRKGIDIMFAVDTSKSMLAEDIKPNRLERAKLAMLDFVQKLEGDRVGLIPFAGSSFLLCPLTIDYDAFAQSLEVLDTNIIPAGGTNLTEVIRKAEQILAQGSNHKILILLSDGEDLEGDALAAATQAAEKELTIFTIGVGTPKGELIPNNGQGKAGFVKDKQGNFVISKLDQAKLVQIAEKTGGIYTSLSGNDKGLEDIYQQKLAMIPKEELAEKKQKLPIERFEWPLALALIVLLVEYLLTTRTKKHAQYLSKFRAKGRKTLGNNILSVVIAASMLTWNPFCADASTGEDAYEKGDYLTALQYYNKMLTKDTDNPKLNYNHGTAAYKNNLYDQAVTSFEKALKSTDPELQRLAYYNQGNSRYQKGQLSMQNEPEKTIEEWTKSLTSYEAALALDPDFKEAKHNHETVSKKLEQLKKQQQNNNNQNKQQNSNNKEKKQNDNKPPKNNNQQQPEQKDSNSEQTPSSSQDQQKQSPKQETGEEKSPKKNEKDRKENKQHASQQSTGTKNQQDAQPLQPRHPGEMTKEEAQQLLDSLKNNEGNLNFVPKFEDKPTNKDW